VFGLDLFTQIFILQAKLAKFLFRPPALLDVPQNQRVKGSAAHLGPRKGGFHRKFLSVCAVRAKTALRPNVSTGLLRVGRAYGIANRPAKSARPEPI